jgi:hypothetical protein
MKKCFTQNDAETIFERLEAQGRTWKVYVMDPKPLSFAGVINYPRLKERLAARFVPVAEFEKDAAAGTMPNFWSLSRTWQRAVVTITLPMAAHSRSPWTWRWTARHRCWRARRSWSGCSGLTAPRRPRQAPTIYL